MPPKRKPYKDLSGLRNHPKPSSEPVSKPSSRPFNRIKHNPLSILDDSAHVDWQAEYNALADSEGLTDISDHVFDGEDLAAAIADLVDDNFDGDQDWVPLPVKNIQKKVKKCKHTFDADYTS